MYSLFIFKYKAKLSKVFEVRRRFVDNGDKRGVGREQREGRRIHFFMDSNSGICNIKNHSQGVVSFNGVPERIGSCCRRRVVVRLCLTGILPSASSLCQTTSSQVQTRHTRHYIFILMLHVESKIFARVLYLF